MKFLRSSGARWTSGGARSHAATGVDDGLPTLKLGGGVTATSVGQGCSAGELLGAAHAACFTMELIRILSDSNYQPESLRTQAQVTLSQDDPQGTVVRLHLTLTGHIPGLCGGLFIRLASQAKASCATSRLFDVDISLDAILNSAHEPA